MINAPRATARVRSLRPARRIHLEREHLVVVLLRKRTTRHALGEWLHADDGELVADGHSVVVEASGAQGGRSTCCGIRFIFWLAFEYLNHDWDLQWPWFSIGNVFGNRPAWIQWYEYTGMLGGSLWVLVVNLLLFRIWRARCREHAWAIRPIVAVGALVLVPIILSIWRAETYEEQGPSAEVVIVQPNIDPYTQKFGGMDPIVQLDSMLHLAERVLTPATRLVVMPETALQEDATMDLRGTKPELHGLWENDLQRSRSAQRIRTFQETHPKVAVLTGMSSSYLFDPGAELPVSARRVQGN